MAVQYGHDADFLGLYSLLRVKAQALASDPTGLGTGDAGRFWFNTTSARLKVWSGTAAIDMTDLANSTGNLVPGRITGFDTQVRTNRLDQMAAPTAAVGLGGQKITGLADGTANTDAATKQQVDAVQVIAAAAASGVAYKSAVRAVATTNITLSGTQTIDGVSLVAGDRVLLTAQSTPATNGIYVVAAGAWSRAADADTNGELAPGTQVAVVEGAAGASSGGNADSIWRLVSDAAITIGTTAQTWERLPGATASSYIGGAGLTLTGSTFDVGAGDGISVATDTVAVNPLRVTRKRSGNVPSATTTVTCDDGTTMSVTVTGTTVSFSHGLNALGAELLLTYGSSPGSGNTQGQRLIPDATNTDANTIVAVLPTGYPAANQLVFSIRG